VKKTIFFISFLILIANIALAQAVKLPTNRRGDVEFKETVSVDGATADQLWERAHKFFKNTYADPKDIIDVDDKDAGKITGYGSIDGGSNYVISYKIEINISNGSYTYNFTPMDYALQGNISAFRAKKVPFTADQPRDIDDQKWAVFTTNTFTTLSQLASQLKATMAK